MVVIGLVVAAIANLIVTVIPNDSENTGETGCFVSTVQVFSNFQKLSLSKRGQVQNPRCEMSFICMRI